MRPAIILFAKSPEPGKVKTRLAKTIGNERAASLYLAMVKDASLAARKTGAEVIWWLEGGTKGLEEVIRDCAVNLQPEGDLGTRLKAAFNDAFLRGFGPVAAMGTDCPSLDSTHLVKLLEKSLLFDSVFIPSPDGGYSAVALKTPLPSVFDDIPWSTPETLQVSLERISDAGKSFRLLEEVEDIDDLESLERLFNFLSEENRLCATNTGEIMMTLEFDFLRAKGCTRKP